MYCEQCGHKNQDGVKFCGSCGAPSGHVGERDVVPRTETPREKSFYDKNGVTITDAVLKFSSGQSYPIRNISSVNAAQKPIGFGALVAGGICVLMSLVLIIEVQSMRAFGFLMLLIGGLALIKAFYRPHYLEIGAGGLPQQALKGSDVNILNEVAGAINEAILHLQKGK